MSKPKKAKPRKPSARERMDAYLWRRQEALRNGGAGLVPVCCEKCGRPIATTAYDRAQGEPPILLDFPEDAKGWTCTDCARGRRLAVVA